MEAKQKTKRQDDKKHGDGNKGTRTSNTPFKRVDSSKVALDAVVDNRYEVKVS